MGATFQQRAGEIDGRGTLHRRARNRKINGRERPAAGPGFGVEDTEVHRAGGLVDQEEGQALILRIERIGRGHRP